MLVVRRRTRIDRIDQYDCTTRRESWAHFAKHRGTDWDERYSVYLDRGHVVLVSRLVDLRVQEIESNHLGRDFVLGLTFIIICMSSNFGSEWVRTTPTAGNLLGTDPDSLLSLQRLHSLRTREPRTRCSAFVRDGECFFDDLWADFRFTFNPWRT